MLVTYERRNGKGRCRNVVAARRATWGVGSDRSASRRPICRSTNLKILSPPSRSGSSEKTARYSHVGVMTSWNPQRSKTVSIRRSAQRRRAVSSGGQTRIPFGMAVLEEYSKSLMEDQLSAFSYQLAAFPDLLIADG